jgi:methylated-DNA-[protein]-cysteine S-methyltransferase
MHVLTVPSPLGPLRIVEAAERLVALDWSAAEIESETPLLREARHQLAAYFAGRLTTFDLPLAPAGSAFQQRVWAAMQAIPYGRTRTYGEMARELRSAARAVGGACGRNPLPIVIPCHRVVASGAGMGGYSGAGGLATKRFLLDLEQPHIAPLSRSRDLFAAHAGGPG